MSHNDDVLLNIEYFHYKKEGYTKIFSPKRHKKASNLNDDIVRQNS